MCFSVHFDTDIRKLAKRYQADIADFAFEKIKKAQESTTFKCLPENGQVYPNYHAPVMLLKDGKRIIGPMRYRIRPQGSVEEVPNKFNVFNARLDSLETRRTWRPLFLRRHGIFIMQKFYEWVDDDNGKKRLISFESENKEDLIVPVLWDRWQGNGQEINSFAVITTDPPSEVLAAGHDRCPIRLDEAQIDFWLSCREREIAYKILRNTRSTTLVHQFQN